MSNCVKCNYCINLKRFKLKKILSVLLLASTASIAYFYFANDKDIENVSVEDKLLSIVLENKSCLKDDDSNNLSLWMTRGIKEVELNVLLNDCLLKKDNLPYDDVTLYSSSRNNFSFILEKEEGELKVSKIEIVREEEKDIETNKEVE